MCLLRFGSHFRFLDAAFDINNNHDSERLQIKQQFPGKIEQRWFCCVGNSRVRNIDEL